jgi:DNA-binding FadR family transcriptional regulator
MSAPNGAARLAPPPVDPSSKRAEQLAGRIEREVMEARWPVGEVIGTEPDLVERFGVSRSILREAVRILEHHRVAEMRRGPGGGLVVTAPDAAAVTRAAVLYLDHEDVSVADLFEARRGLELLSVERAARTVDEAGVERLRAVLGDEAASGAPGHHSHELHNVLAELSGNPVLALFVDVLVSLTEHHMRPVEALAVAAGGDRQSLEGARRAHEAIVEAVVAGDAALARHRMRRHVEGIEAFLADAGPAATLPA